MKRFFSSVVIALLFFAPSAEAAPKKIAVKPMQQLLTIGNPDEVSGVVTSSRSIIIFGSKEFKAYARAIDNSGKELWNLSLDQSPASIATTAAVDAAGDIWIAGATPLAMGLVPPSPTSTPVNPDNASTPVNTLIGDLKAISIWKVSTNGTILFTNTFPTSFGLLPTSIAVDRSGASIVGILANEKGNSGFLINTDASGVFGKLLKIGSNLTTADAVVRHGDGSFTVTGSSSDTLLGKKVAGITDGVILKISKALKITNVVRSSAQKGKRIWSAATSTLLLGGEVVTGNKTETAITKFSSTYVPSWTYRFTSTGDAKTAGSTHALLISTGAVPQLSWSPKSPTPLLITFDAKGAILAADSAPAGQKDLVGLLNSKELGVLVVTSNPDAVSIFTPVPR